MGHQRTLFRGADSRVARSWDTLPDSREPWTAVDRDGKKCGRGSPYTAQGEIADVSQNTYDAIVVGAGHNGLTNATYLARSGLKVLLHERKPGIGGSAVCRKRSATIAMP